MASKPPVDPRRKRALAVYKKMGWGTNQGIRDLDEDLWQLTTDFLFGEVWSRPGLGLREREIITITTLMGQHTDGIRAHLRKAHHLGITYAELKEIILHATYYLGTPRGFWAMRHLRAVMDEHAAEGIDGARPGRKTKKSVKKKAAVKARSPR